MREGVGVEYETAASAQYPRNGAFSAADASGYSDAQHQLRAVAGIAPAGNAFRPRRMAAAFTVLLISMAMVSGPTPPGTGVYAPAMLTTSG